MKVSNYILKASNGKRIRIATKVTFADGREVKFIDRLSKKEASKQATNMQMKCACPQGVM